MQTKTLFGGLTAALIIGWGVASGHDGIDAGSSYVTAGGKALVADAGNCVRTGGWSEDTSVGACEGEEEVAEVAPIKVAAVAPPPPPVEAPVSVEKVVLSGRAMFPFDSSQLTDRGATEMSELLTRLEGYQELVAVDVIGHTDDRGSDEYNQWLSERRANVVKDSLSDAFPDVPVTSSGAGEANPVSSNDTSDGRRLNRRVEIKIEAVK